MGAHQRQVGVVKRIADGAGVPNEVQRRQIFCLQPVAKPVGNVGPVEVGLRVFFPEFSDADNDLFAAGGLLLRNLRDPKENCRNVS